MHGIRWQWLILALVLLPALPGAAAPAFVDPPEVSTDGGFTLAWDAEAPVQLEQASGPDHADARIIYEGSDTSTVISGLPDGEYRFRLRAVESEEWADEARVHVEHHSLARAFGFFVVGGLVFLVLIIAILRGGART